MLGLQSETIFIIYLSTITGQLETETFPKHQIHGLRVEQTMGKYFLKQLQFKKYTSFSNPVYSISTQFLFLQIWENYEFSFRPQRIPWLVGLFFILFRIVLLLLTNIIIEHSPALDIQSEFLISILSVVRIQKYFKTL